MSYTTAPIATGRARSLEVPIHVPFTIARESRPVAALALVELVDARGTTGLGECSPFPSLTGDDAASAAAVAGELVAELGGQTPAAGRAWLATRRAEIRQRSTTAYVGVEMALWDLEARSLGRSLASLWGAHDGREQRTDVTLPIMAPAAVPGFWARFAGHGFTVVKVKVSGNVTQDRDMIQALRALLPTEMALTLDGNQGFTLAAAKQLLAELARLGARPLFFEQPLPAGDHAGLAALQAATPVPVCLDESVKTVADARAAIQGRWGGLINVKLMKSGIAEARAIIDVARAAKVPLMLGGMLESEVAMATSLHLACGTGAIAYADLDTPFFFTESLTKRHPWQAGSAQLALPTGSGHGLELRKAGSIW